MFDLLQVQLRKSRLRGAMQETLGRLSGAVLDLVFPLNCAVCNREGQLLCEGCEGALPRLERPYCLVCASPGRTGLCQLCVSMVPAIDGIRAPYLFDGIVRELVYDLKYRDLRAAAPDLGRLLAAYLESNPMPADLLVPVPLHGRRIWERGYNQSELLSKELSKRTGMPMETGVLHRTRNTPPQVSMKNPEERRRNIEGAFECLARGSQAPRLDGRRILLVDDIVTTGSTMFACASALKAAGAGSVWGLALARQGHSATA